MRRRRSGGKLAQSIGSGFEELFKANCNRSATVCIRIPNGAKTYRDKFGQLQLARTRSPFDFLITRAGRSAVVDAKTVDADRISYSFIVDHQLDKLLEAGASINAGYVVWFRKSNTVVFYSAFRLNKIKPGDGLGINDGLHLGTGESFDVKLIFEWTDDGVSKEPIYQQRLF